jgi:uncharacterized protein with PIN domain
MLCNNPIARVEKDAVLQDLPKKVRELHDEFYRCAGCRKVYWKGSHYHDMMSQIQRLAIEAAKGGAG